MAISLHTKGFWLLLYWLFDSKVTQNTENSTVAKSLPLFLDYFVKCLFIKRLI